MSGNAVAVSLSDTWTSRAACRGADPRDFFDTDPAGIARAKAVCSRCEVREDCLNYAVEHHEQGVWGGLDETERDSLNAIVMNEHCPVCSDVLIQVDDGDQCLSCGVRWFR